jgi:hypothetical protein
LQTLSGVSGVQLRVEFQYGIFDRDDLALTQWLRQHGQNISHLTVKIDIREDRLQLKEFAEAAAPCRDIDLNISHDPNEMIDMAELAALAGSLSGLTCWCNSDDDDGIVRGLDALSSLQQLTSLSLLDENITTEQPWDYLAKLTNLRQLCLHGHASGDPSPLSALTRLSALVLGYWGSIETFWL